MLDEVRTQGEDSHVQANGKNQKQIYPWCSKQEQTPEKQQISEF